MKVFGGIYFIVNKIDGKMYVGQTIRPLNVRFGKHCYADSLLGRAIRKYGREHFRCEILKHCASKAEMDAWEKFFIAALKTKKPYGYNLTDGGEGIIGWHHTPETCAKISAALCGENHPNYGKHPTDETIAKISNSSCGEKNPFFGKHHPKELCAKSSVSQRGYSPFKNLLNEIDKHQFTYAALAKLMGISRKALSAKMCDKLKFTDKNKDKLEEIFGLPAEYLLQRAHCRDARQLKKISPADVHDDTSKKISAD